MSDERYTLPWAFSEITRLDREKASKESVRQVAEDVAEMKDDQRWTRRTVTATFLMLVANLVLLWVNLGAS